MNFELTDRTKTLLKKSILLQLRKMGRLKRREERKGERKLGKFQIYILGWDFGQKHDYMPTEIGPVCC